MSVSPVKYKNKFWVGKVNFNIDNRTNNQLSSRTYSSNNIIDTTETTYDVPSKIFGNWLLEVRKLSHKTPFLVTNLGVVKNNIDHLISLLPDVKIFYAIKSNPDAKLIQTIDSKIAGYDIASLGEFEYLKSLGISPKRMIFSNPIKIPAHIHQTFQEGVGYFSFDTKLEIIKLSKSAPGSSVFLRIKVSDSGSSFPLSRKFGVDPDNAIQYLLEAKEAGLNPIGLAFHVGSQSDNPDAWKLAFTICKDIFKSAERQGLELFVINMGGGIPAEYTTADIHLREIADVINQEIANLSPYIIVIAEPGRSISATSSVIVTSIIGKGDRGYCEDWLYLDMGVFQGLMEPLQMSSWRYPIYTDYDDIEANKQKYVLTGPSCDAYDTIGLNYELPIDLELHDRIYIASTGAYTIVYASAFNGFPPPQIYYIQ